MKKVLLSLIVLALSAVAASAATQTLTVNSTSCGRSYLNCQNIPVSDGGSFWLSANSNGTGYIYFTNVTDLGTVNITSNTISFPSVNTVEEVIDFNGGKLTLNFSYVYTRGGGGRGGGGAGNIYTCTGGILELQ